MGTLTWRQDSGISYWQLHDDDEYVAWVVHNREEQRFYCLAWEKPQHSNWAMRQLTPGTIDIEVDNIDDAKAYVVALYRMGG